MFHHFIRHHHFHAPFFGHHGGGHGSRGPRMFDAGSLRYVVLQLIADQPRHGYQIIKEIEDRIGGGYSPSPGVIYPLLTMLEDLGHVVVTPDGNKKLHTITPEGQAFLEENRALVDSIVARMSGSSQRRRGGDIRMQMHELKALLIMRVRGERLADEQIARIGQILSRAIQEIREV